MDRDTFRISLIITMWIFAGIAFLTVKGLPPTWRGIVALTAEVLPPLTSAWRRLLRQPDDDPPTPGTSIALAGAFWGFWSFLGGMMLWAVGAGLIVLLVVVLIGVSIGVAAGATAEQGRPIEVHDTLDDHLDPW